MPVERIVSLVPGATETLFALGLGDRVRAVSHACDHPPQVEHLPTATRTRLDVEASSREIDETVRGAVDEAEPIFAVLGEVLHHAQPDLVLTQEACQVCGITPVDVEAALARIEPVNRPEIVSLHPHTLADVIADVERIADAAGAPECGTELAGKLAERVEAVAELAATMDERPRVAALDWLDPPMAAGHWIPGMVETAGGQPVLLDDDSPSSYVGREDVAAAEPDVLLAIPCGFGAERSLAEAEVLVQGSEAGHALQEARVAGLDAGAYTSRPGPRLVDGLEQIACALHGQPAAERWPQQASRVRHLAPQPSR